MSRFDEVVDRRVVEGEKWGHYKNQDIIPMWVADTDFKAPQAVIDALQKRVSHGVFGYTKVDKQTNQAVVDFIKRHYDWEIEAQWIVWLPGVVSGMNITCQTIKTKDVITTTPIYPHFVKAPKAANKEIIQVPLREIQNRWTVDFEEFEKAISPTCKLFMLCNPHNPAGTVFTKQELQKFSDICIKHDLTLCSDEIHADLIINSSAKHIPIASLNKEIAKKTITLLAPSKTFNIAGLQSSYAVISDTKLREAFEKTLGDITSQINLLAITATKTAYEDCDEWLFELRDYLKKNLTLLQEFIKNQPKLKLLNQDATYLAWIDISKLNLENPYEYFISHGVELTKGSSFGDKNFLRLNFGTTTATLKEGLKRVKKAIESL